MLVFKKFPVLFTYGFSLPLTLLLLSACQREATQTKNSPPASSSAETATHSPNTTAAPNVSAAPSVSAAPAVSASPASSGSGPKQEGRVFTIFKDRTEIGTIRCAENRLEPMKYTTQDAELTQAFQAQLDKTMETANSSGLSYKYHTWSEDRNTRYMMGGIAKPGQENFCTAFYTTIDRDPYGVSTQYE